MKKLIITALTVIGIIARISAYDKEMAKSMQEFFKPFSEKNTSKAMQKITTAALLKRIELDEKFFFLDMRTEAEVSIVRLGFENTLVVPMDKVFNEENLKKLPTDQNIVVICAKGSRATVTAMALRLIGFEKTYILVGGLAGLTDYLCPKKVYK